jgi:hypothetical protein
MSIKLALKIFREMKEEPTDNHKLAMKPNQLKIILGTTTLLSSFTLIHKRMKKAYFNNFKIQIARRQVNKM